MTNRTTEEIARGLTEAAERCEQASGPDRELDVLVFQAVGAPVPFQFANRIVALAFDEAEQCYFAPIGDMRIRYEPPAFTASIDAAMTLVLEGIGDGNGDLWEVYIDRPFRGKWIASLHSPWNAGRPFRRFKSDDCANGALALTVACLRALAVRSHLESHPK